MRQFIVFFSLLMALCLLECCSKLPDGLSRFPDQSIIYEYDMGNLEFHDGFYEAESRGVPENRYIVEASGLAVSRSNPSMIWVHNDSGDYNRLFVVGENSGDYGEFIIRGTHNRDWEAMAAGPGPVRGVTYLYIGDIGDNYAQYDIKSVYRVPEPDISALDSVAYAPVEGAERFDYIYPDGLSRDVETLMLDPLTKDIYIVSKTDLRSILYVAPYPQSTGTLISLKEVGSFPFNRAVAGDISPDGREIVIKTDDRIYYWKRNQGEALFEALRRQPLLLPYTLEPQGETLGWMPDGS